MVGRVVSDFVFALITCMRAPNFILRHRLWKGFTDYKLVVITILILGLLSGITFLQSILEWWQGIEITSVGDIGVQAASLFSNVFDSEFNLFNSGAYKYLVLIVMELLIFHTVIKTRAILTGEMEDLTTKLFLTAQIRMIKVSLFTWVAEMVFKIMLTTALSIVGLKFLDGGLSFLIECFFLGFVLVDNYNELNGMDIKPSFKYTMQFMGASTAIGLFMYLLILIPMLGPILGTLFGAVAATIIMHELGKRAPYVQEVTTK